MLFSTATRGAQIIYLQSRSARPTRLPQVGAAVSDAGTVHKIGNRAWGEMGEAARMGNTEIMNWLGCPMGSVLSAPSHRRLGARPYSGLSITA